MAYLGGAQRPTPFPPHGPQSPTQVLVGPAATAPPPQRPDIHYNALKANPLFGRPVQRAPYTQYQTQGALGPPLAGNYQGGATLQQPRQMGTGLTGRPSPPGIAPVLPGYMSSNAYQPSGQQEYAPDLEPDFLQRIPATLNTPGTYDGIAMLGTYRAHDFVFGAGDMRFNHQKRSAPNWQVMMFPPDFRQLLQRQQVMKYNVRSYTQSSTPVRQTDYFLGYYTQPAVAAKLGVGGLGYMGSQ